MSPIFCFYQILQSLLFSLSVGIVICGSAWLQERRLTLRLLVSSWWSLILITKAWSTPVQPSTCPVILVFSTDAGTHPVCPDADKDGVHFISEQLTSRCGYTISTLKMDSFTTFRASYYSCFTHNQVVPPLFYWPLDSSASFTDNQVAPSPFHSSHTHTHTHTYKFKTF